MGCPSAEMGAWGRRGVGSPATAGKRWPHFFQMGKLRHKEVWELAQVTHSESAFGEGSSSHWETESYRLQSPSHWGVRTGRKGLRAQGCLESNHQPLLGGLVGRPGKGLCLELGRAKIQ